MQPTLIRHIRSRPDADQHIMRFMMTPLQKVNIVGRNQPEPELLRQTRQHQITFSLGLNPMVVHFKEEVFRT